MANEKIIAQDVFEQSIKDILTLLVNNTYNFTEYTDEEVGNLIDLDPTQIAELTAVISDSVVAKNKVFSSSHTTELIQKSVIESNEYADSLVANLSNIKLDIVDTLPDASTVNKSTIYILKDSTGGTNNTLNVWSDATSAFVEVGKLDVNMDSYYTKSDVDTLLADKADNNNVVHQEDIVSNLTITSGTTTLSTAGLQTELDKKANDNEVLKKTDISTSIDSASTDDEIPTSKAVETRILKRETIKNVDLNTFVDEGKYYIDSGCTNSPVDGGYLNIMRCNDDYVCQICARYNIAASNNTYIRTRVDGKWGTWKKVCTTSVVDVPLTSLAWADTSYFENAFTRCNYQVKNGICFVNIDMICNSPMTGGYKLPITLPAPTTEYVHFSVSSLPNGAYVTSSVTIAVAGSGTQVVAYGGVATHRYLGMLSYPVAES